MTSQLHTCLNCSQTITSSIYNTLHLPHILLLLLRVCIVSSTWPSATTIRLPRKNIIQINVLPTIENVLLFKPADVFLPASSCGFFQFPLELGIFRVVYSVVTDPAPSQRHDKIGMMTARHRVGPCRYRDGGGKSGNFIVTRGRPRWISHSHVR